MDQESARREIQELRTAFDAMRADLARLTMRLSALDAALRPNATPGTRPTFQDTLGKFAAHSTVASPMVDAATGVIPGPPPVVVTVPGIHPPSAGGSVDVESIDEVVARQAHDSIRPTTFRNLPEPPTRGTSEIAEMRFGATWFNRIGAIILLLAVVFFVKYSFDQGWLGPRTRVLLAAATGLLLIVGGEYSLSRKLWQFAVGLIGAGVAMLYVAAYSAHSFYNLVGPTTAFWLYCGITLHGALLAVHGRMQAVAILTLIGAFLTPIALSTGRNAQVELLTYLLVVDAGFLLVGLLRRWDALRPMCWLGTTVMFLGWAFKFYEPDALWVTLGFIGAFYALFHGEALNSARRNWGMQSLVLPGIVHLNNIVFFASVYFLADATQHKWMGLFCVLMGLTQWALAWLIRRPDGASMRTQTSLAIDGAFILALAAPIQFDNSTVAIAWGVQSVACLYFTRWLPDVWLRVKGLGVLIAAVVHLVLVDLNNPALLKAFIQTPNDLWHLNNLILCVGFISLCAFAGVACLRWSKQALTEDALLSVALAGIGLALLLGISAQQYDRYVATVCWLVLFVMATGVGRVLPTARVMAVCIALAATAKYMAWDLIAAMDRKWAELDGVVLNRAVYCGVALAAALVLARRDMAACSIAGWPEKWSKSLRSATAILAVLVIFAAGTFEIARVFTFEPVGQAATNPSFAKELWRSMFWSAIAIASLTIGMVGNLRELRYLAVAIFVVTIAKVMIVDMSDVGMVYRIVSFGVLGVLLLLASLFYQKRWSRLHRVSPDASATDA